MQLLEEPIWARFWYPVALESGIGSEPVRRTLLNHPLVLWREPGGAVAAAIDRCPHRDAPLSSGWVEDGCIVCPYHGWRFDGTGELRLLPQSPELSSLGNRYQIQTVNAEVLHGAVWVNLARPVAGIPPIPSIGPGWRYIPEFDEEWETHAARLMENSFDPAHTVFVHRKTFGDGRNPVVEVPSLEERPYGFSMSNRLSVANPDFARSVTGAPGEYTVRDTVTLFFAPFIRVMISTYPAGVVHAIVTAATPVNEHRLRLVQWVLRNDREEDAPESELVSFDRRVTREDQELLESIWAPYSSEVNANVHMRADRASIALRRLWGKISAGTWLPETVEEGGEDGLRVIG